MKRKRRLIIFNIVAIVLLTIVGGILESLASSLIPKDYFPYVWLALGVVAIATIGFSVRQYRLQEDSEQRPQSVQNRQRLIEKVRAKWIKDVLEKSLHNAALIALGLHEQPGAVVNPWHLVLQPPDQENLPLPAGTHIAKVYDDAGGELLILGEPGAGKTTLLLELARDLLDRAQQNENLQIPVVFNLSSWAVKRQALTDWLVEELNVKYLIPRILGQSWVDADQIQPLLDGLDEVKAEYRKECVKAINAYRQEHGIVPNVVCSRTAEYFQLESLTLLRKAVVVQPLTDQQIDDYLSSAGGQLAAIRVALREDAVLKELATKPLMLSIMTLTYRGKTVEDILVGSLETRRQVFEKYVQRMLERRGTDPRYTTQQTISWLTWLARQMAQHGQTEFYIERMQMDLLPDDRSRSVYHVAIERLIPSFLTSKIEPVEIVSWSRQNLLHPGVLMFGLSAGLSVGLMFGLLFGAIFGPSVGVIVGVIGVPLGVPIGGLLFLLYGVPLREMLSGIRFETLDKHKIVTPNQGIRSSARNGLMFGLSAGLISGMMFGPSVGVIFGLSIGLSAGVIAGLLGGFIFGLFFGGYAFIQHFILRFILWRAGSMPWKYPRFLDYAADRILLRKVGGGYIFVHRLLLEYFASLDTTPTATISK